MSRVVLSQVTKSFGNVTALHAIDLEIQEGEFLTLLGPSGCGRRPPCVWWRGSFSLPAERFI